MAYPKGFILITSIVLMFVCSSIIFAYFMKISHEYQRVEINIVKARAKYNALSGFALEAYENMFFRDFITDTLANGEPADSVQFYVGGGIEGTGTIGGMGNFDSVSVRIRKTDGGQLVRYGHAKGMADYRTIFGKTITLADSVDITTGPLPSLNRFMYLTGDELAGGAPHIMYGGARSTVRFRSADEFDGSNGLFQTNGTLALNGPPNCPEFQSTVTLTMSEGEVNEPDLNGCNFNNVFLGEPPTDTSTTVCLPPPSFDQKKQFADYIFDATELLVSDGNSYPGGIQRDTLIMTELDFLSNGGFRVSRYKYLMPPHLAMNLTQANTPSNPNGNDLETNGFDDGGTPLACNGFVEVSDCIQYEEALNRYHAKTRAVLNNNNDVYIDSDVRGAHGVHHFDTHLFQYDPGHDSEFEPDGISNNSTELTTNYYYPLEPVAIYVKGGPVLVHGTFKGRYTVITDEYMTYRRHAYPVNTTETPIDTIYCNIWLVGDLVNADATWSGSVASLSEAQPTDKCEGGSENGIGLVSGANVIIANTRKNGARSGSASGGGLNINIHAHMIAFNESFTIQYWQNSTTYWNRWKNSNPASGSYPGDVETTLADGNGMRYGTYANGSYLEDDDDRGNVYLWGGFVQLFRGFMFRNQTGPYLITPGIGMDKHYFWDDNQRCNMLPLYPEDIECSNQAGPEQYDFPIAQFRIF